MTSSAQPVLRAVDVSRSFPSPTPGAPALELFHHLNLVIAPGERVAIVGSSGAGKSSLLHLLAGLDRATTGEVWLGSARLDQLPAARAAEVRNREIGFVWQFHYLLPEFSAAENVSLPLMARGMPRLDALGQAAHWLDRVGLASRGNHRTSELSGGEQQRVAIARALVTQPSLLLADEPTGDLDDRTADQVFTLLTNLARESALAMLLVTHNLALASQCDRTLQLHAGALRPALQPFSQNDVQ